MLIEFIYEPKYGGTMIRKLTTIFFITLIFVAFVQLSYAGNVNKDLKKQAVEKQIVTDEMEAEMQAQIREYSDLIFQTIKNKNVYHGEGILASGDTIGWTVRDFTMNTCMGRKIAYDPATGNVHTIFTQWEPNATDPYHEYYNFYDASYDLWFGVQSVDPSLDAFNTRSGRVLVGPAGEAWVSFHDHSNNQTYLANDASPGGYAFTNTPIAPGRFASACYKDGGVNWFTTNDEDGNFEVDRLFNSTDGGATWTQTANFLPLPGAPDPISNVEIYPHFNPVNGNVGVFYCNDAATNDLEGLWWGESSDLGDNWTATEVYHEETILNDNVWHLIENFSQQMSETDENGVTHLVFNGYGFLTDGTDPDSILYPVMDVGYWNSTMSSFEERVVLTDSLVGRNAPVTTYMNTNAVGSGNNLGNAFPSIAIGPNGVLAVIWEQGELAPGDTSLVIATDPTGTPDPAGIYANDLYCAVSSDYGVTWSDPFYIAGTPGKCDRSPSLAKDIEYDGTSYYIHYVYMYDPDPGQDLPNPPTAPAAWVYGNFDITAYLPPPSGVVEEDNVVRKFELEQNFPNPFNPTTDIRFNLSHATQVTLDVYNVIGEKVATLINGNVKAGEHTAVFNGADYASGVYFYQLTAGDFVQSRKMLLVK